MYFYIGCSGMERWKFNWAVEKKGGKADKVATSYILWLGVFSILYFN